MNDPRSDVYHMHKRFVVDQAAVDFDAFFNLNPDGLGIDHYYRCPMCHGTDGIVDATTTSNTILCIQCRVPMISIHRYGSNTISGTGQPK